MSSIFWRLLVDVKLPSYIRIVSNGAQCTLLELQCYVPLYFFKELVSSIYPKRNEMEKTFNRLVRKQSRKRIFLLMEYGTLKGRYS